MEKAMTKVFAFAFLPSGKSRLRRTMNPGSAGGTAPKELAMLAMEPSGIDY